MSVSIPTSNTFSTRNAIVPERSARPLSSADSVGRDTPSAADAPATVSPSGSIASVLMKAPGCGGFAMRMVDLPPTPDAPAIAGQPTHLPGAYRHGSVALHAARVKAEEHDPAGDSDRPAMRPGAGGQAGRSFAARGRGLHRRGGSRIVDGSRQP